MLKDGPGEVSDGNEEHIIVYGEEIILFVFLVTENLTEFCSDFFFLKNKTCK